MPKIIFASNLYTHTKDEQGVRHPIVLQNNNSILDNIKACIGKRDLFVWVCNFEDAYEENDIRANVVFKSFNLAGVGFKKYVILDNRNYQDSKDLIINADLVLLSGGKITTQKHFLDKVGFDKLIAKTNALIIGISAGAMNLGLDIYNFPEEIEDLAEPRELTGLGYFDKPIIPHFDGENLKYQLEYHTIDPIKDYVLPYSHTQKLIGIDNDSYIMLKDNKYSYWGNIYNIENGKVNNINV